MVAHPIQIRGAFASVKDSSRRTPTILQMREQDFIDRLINDLSTSEGRKRLQADIASNRTKNNVLRLYQPVHRLMHLALVDVSCALPGEPRLDPNRILGAGVVVRRVDQRGNQQGWMKKNGEIVGWRTLPTADDNAASSYDPDPKLRENRRLGRNAPLLKMLTPANSKQTEWEEDYTSLFAAPPDVCKSAGKTFLYGTIPLSSAEYIEGSESIQSPPFSKADIRKRMPTLFKTGGAERKNLPETNMELTANSRKLRQASNFFKVLEFLAQGTGLFTDTPGTEQLRNTLERIPLADMTMVEAYLQFLQLNISPKDTKQTSTSEREVKMQIPVLGGLPAFDLTPNPSLGGFLRQAFEILIGQPEDETAEAKAVSASIRLPKAWPTIPTSTRAGKSTRGYYPVTDEMILDAIYTAMTARWNTLQQVTGRYEQTDATYVICAFIRVQDRVECPPRTLWTAPSEPFEIVPWYESGDLPPAKVELPDIDRNMLSKLKPNVSFKVPPSVQKFMENINLDDLIAGEKPKEGSLDFGMICGFNIPIITLCAFIVLSIFLALLNILFWWLPFVKICIPFPKKQ